MKCLHSPILGILSNHASNKFQLVHQDFFLCQCLPVQKFIYIIKNLMAIIWQHGMMSYIKMSIAYLNRHSRGFIDNYDSWILQYYIPKKGKRKGLSYMEVKERDRYHSKMAETYEPYTIRGYGQTSVLPHCSATQFSQKGTLGQY